MGDFYIEDEVSFPFHTVEEAVNDIKEGKMVVVVDDKTLESTGVIVADASQMDACNVVASVADTFNL